VDHAIPVVGIDSLRYFWGKKTPAVVAADLTRVLRHYLERWGEERVLLIGYSLGAEGALFMATGLPADLRSRLARVVLLGPATHTDLEVHVGDWLGLGEAGGYPLRPEAAKLPADRILCVYGSEDRDASLCPTLKGAAVVEIPGGHHFNHDYERLGRVILDGLR
jgi:type IV secretory pathway VirJ component